MACETKHTNKDITLAFVASDASGNLGQPFSIGNVELTSDKLETTTYSSSNFKEYCPGLSDVSEIPVSVYLDTSNNATNYHGNMIDYQLSGEDIAWTITFVDGSIFTFNAFVMSASISPAIGEKMTMDLTLAPTNSTDPTFTNAT